MRDEWAEVAVRAQQRGVVPDAPGRDQGVDRLAHGDAGNAQATIVAGGFDRGLAAADLDYGHGIEKAESGPEVAPGFEALQYFG